VEPKELKQGIILEKISPIAEVLKEVDKSLEELKEIIHDKFVDILPPIKDIQHHGASILYGFEDSFMRKESDRDESFNFFKLISLTISTWAQLVP